MLRSWRVGGSFPIADMFSITDMRFSILRVQSTPVYLFRDKNLPLTHSVNLPILGRLNSTPLRAPSFRCQTFMPILVHRLIPMHMRIFQRGHEYSPSIQIPRPFTEVLLCIPQSREQRQVIRFPRRLLAQYRESILWNLMMIIISSNK